MNKAYAIKLIALFGLIMVVIAASNMLDEGMIRNTVLSIGLVAAFFIGGIPERPLNPADVEELEEDDESVT